MRRRCTACTYARGVVPQDIDQIKWCLLNKITVVSLIIKVNELLLKSVILGLDPDAFNRLWTNVNPRALLNPSAPYVCRIGVLGF